MAGKNSWLLPMVVGVGIGWFFSGTLSNVLNPIASRFGVSGGHVGYAYQGTGNTIDPAVAPRIEPYERRSFDRAYDSYLHTTVNSLPTQA